MTSFNHSDFFHSFSKSVLRITECAALACFDHIGSGDRETADRSAVHAMKQAFQNLAIRGTVIIGEGERDKAPMLHIGEKLGLWNDHDPALDIAVDPLEGTNLCAKALGGALTVIALSEKGGLFQAPDLYMEKIACGPKAKGKIDLSKSVAENMKVVAKALDKDLSAMTVAILNRPRHQELIQSIYNLGSRVLLIEDGDLSASILTSWKESPVDLLLGTGGAPEGVLSASALKCLGGDFQGRLVFRNQGEKDRAVKMGVRDLDRIYKRNELVKKPVVFCATGVTRGALLDGVRKNKKQMQTETLFMDSLSGERSITQTSYRR